MIHIYNIEITFLSDIFGPNTRSIQRWYRQFIRTGTVRDKLQCLHAPKILSRVHWDYMAIVAMIALNYDFIFLKIYKIEMNKTDFKTLCS